MPSKKNPFLPFISDLDAEAEAFLSRYNYAEVISNPMPVPILDIARRMTLDIIDTEYLSAEGSVQGAIAFDNGIIDVFDLKEQQITGFEVHPAMVFIDASIVNEGRRKNTLAHECFHWYKHRHYFLFERKYNDSKNFAFRCENGNANASSGRQAFTDIERMEWQAKMMAPRILMPKKASEKCLNQLLAKHKYLEDRDDATKLLVNEFAKIFEVSNQSAAIRIAELGYSPAMEYSSLEGNVIHKQISSHVKSQAKQHMQPISLEAAFELYRTNELLQSTLRTGAFCFADGYFVLNDDLYVTGEKEDHLTEYAKAHLAECTLDFSIKFVASSLSNNSQGLMYRGDLSFSIEQSFDANTQNTELFNKAKDFEKRFTLAKKNHKTAAAWMAERMEEEHWNRLIFEDRTGLDAMNFSRVQNKPNHPFTLKPLVAMGVGLNLTLNEMNEVLQLAGYAFSPTNKEHKAYEYLFTGMYGKGINECNEFLKRVGVSPLGTQTRNFDDL